MAKPADPLRPMRPAPGDLVIAPNDGTSTLWAICRWQGPAELAATSYKQAVEIVQPVAQVLGVDLWRVLENGEYQSVATHRRAVPTSTPSRMPAGTANR